MQEVVAGGKGREEQTAQERSTCRGGRPRVRVTRTTTIRGLFAWQGVTHGEPSSTKSGVLLASYKKTPLGLALVRDCIVGGVAESFGLLDERVEVRDAFVRVVGFGCLGVLGRLLAGWWWIVG